MMPSWPDWFPAWLCQPDSFHKRPQQSVCQKLWKYSSLYTRRTRALRITTSCRRIDKLARFSRRFSRQTDTFFLLTTHLSSCRHPSSKLFADALFSGNSARAYFVRYNFVASMQMALFRMKIEESKYRALLGDGGEEEIWGYSSPVALSQHP